VVFKIHKIAINEMTPWRICGGVFLSKSEGKQTQRALASFRPTKKPQGLMRTSHSKRQTQCIGSDVSFQQSPVAWRAAGKKETQKASVL